MKKRRYSKQETKILCEEIKRRYSILDYVRRKGIPVIDRGNRYFITCPFHGDNDPSLCIEEHGEFELFHCFGCKTSGSIIDFFANYEKVSVGEAIRRLGEGIDFDYDIMEMLDEFGEEERRDNLQDFNAAVSIHCFEYLSLVKSRFSEDVLDGEFKKMDRLYRKIDEFIEEDNREKMEEYYDEICLGSFLTERLKMLEGKE